jgi:hypothetical protein
VTLRTSHKNLKLGRFGSTCVRHSDLRCAFAMRDRWAAIGRPILQP